MRPTKTLRVLKSHSVSSTRRAPWLAAALLIACLVGAPAAIACMLFAPDKSAEVSLSLAPGVDAAIQLSFFENEGAGDAKSKPTCDANAFLPLSAFPSTSNRFDTSDIAAAIRGQVDAWELSECFITLYYENDTKVDLARHELCVQSTFAFEKGSFWSTDSESYCWDPAESERIQNLIAEEEAEVEAQVEVLANMEWETE